MKDDAKIKSETAELPYLKINIIDEMEILEHEIRDSGEQAFKKTTYWNQQKSGLADLNPEQISRISEQLERVGAQLESMAAQLERVDAQLERIQVQSERIEARLERIQAWAAKREFI